MPRRPFVRTVLITGASGGLGAALALEYARDDRVLFLGARRAGPLEEVAGACRLRGAEVHTRVIDVCDRAAMEAWVRQADALSPLGLVIANAGVSAGTSGLSDSAEPRAAIDRIFATNVDGVFNTVLPALACLEPRGSGQIAIMASLAGLRGMPGAPAYCASKAAVRVWGEAMRARLKPRGVRLSVICPGFVRTPMTDVNRFRMPFLMEPDRAARLIRKGLEANRGRISFPWPLALGSWLLAALPDAAAGWLAGRTPEK
ncbi:SDR family NAD(P)-dependent oxidoreductase [Phaeovibrio sulfidiphilus]|uniref:SDR family NAD(P)-dependent oxidoreductase n=1 Tax=Phaeovibrio sulfidiphilus TaxID=1220600 RepID=A0A8J7CCU7_9PROT|nr:SDR family NAD(P)-dependent oxidoreductase [Phaeovibrio sulfidiphilus]MBE1236169.1 SDR family NAD(P)-dependent oxidoreductase [Phaeovibrio sulfidiphilus]